MPRHTDPILRRLAPLGRAGATAGLTAAALVVGVGGYAVATSPALAQAPGDRLALAELFGGDGGEVSASGDIDPAAIREADLEQASRSQREPLAAGLPSTSAEAQEWIDEVGTLEATLEQKAAEEAAAKAAAEEAARKAAEEEAARVAAEEEAARVAAEEEAARVAAEQAAAEEAAAAAAAAAPAAPPSGPVDPGSNRALGQSLLAGFGFGADQWPCLDSLWQKESGWNHLAQNPSSGAYGIPQSLPGDKMATVGSDWQTNPETQIRWGLGYTQGRYGTPCAAWQHSQVNNWY
jgi:hypothetical protein